MKSFIRVDRGQPRFDDEDRSTGSVLHSDPGRPAAQNRIPMGLQQFAVGPKGAVEGGVVADEHFALEVAVRKTAIDVEKIARHVATNIC